MPEQKVPSRSEFYLSAINSLKRLSVSVQPSDAPLKLGDLEIVDANRNGKYDKDVDKIVGLSPNSKEAKEFEKKYKIDLNSNRQFDLVGARLFVGDLDDARRFASQGRVEEVIQKLAEAQQEAQSSNLPVDAQLKAAILLEAKKAGVTVAMGRAEIAAENGYFAAANYHLDNARSWAEDIAIAQGKKKPDPTLYDVSRAAILRKTAYRKEIQSVVERAKWEEGRMSRVYWKIAEALVLEAKEKFGLTVPMEVGTLPTEREKTARGTQFQLSPIFTGSGWTLLRRAEDAAKQGDVEAVKNQLSWLQHETRIDQERAIDLIHTAQSFQRINEYIKTLKSLPR